jgi:hypothetical protein
LSQTRPDDTKTPIGAPARTQYRKADLVPTTQAKVESYSTLVVVVAAGDA